MKKPFLLLCLCAVLVLSAATFRESNNGHVRGGKAPILKFTGKPTSVGAGSLPDGRPPVNERKFTSPAIEAVITNITSRMKDADLATLFSNCFPNTLDTTVEFEQVDSTTYDTFIITGDIEAMWLRDSTNQVLPYVQFVGQDENLKHMIEGVINRQINSVLIDPYANAFNKYPDDAYKSDNTYKPGFLGSSVPAMTFDLHERKFEIDSLLSVIKLSLEYYRVTQSKSFFQENTAWIQAMSSIINVLTDEQKGSDEGYSYFFQRLTTTPTDSLMFGVGPPGKRNGMIRSPFRPSDDASAMPYPIAANAMAVVCLNELSQLLNDIGQTSLASAATSLAEVVDSAIQKNGKVNHPIHGQIYAYEIDGFGSSYMMDDAGIPSLLSLPYLGYVEKNDPFYLNTREYILSEYNPYYSEGSAGKGVGSPHAGINKIWPMSIIIQALTSRVDSEIMDCLDMLKESSAGTGFIHESFNKDNVNDFTRPWFAWVNSLFGELILTLANEKPYLIFK